MDINPNLVLTAISGGIGLVLGVAAFSYRWGAKVDSKADERKLQEMETRLTARIHSLETDLARKADIEVVGRMVTTLEVLKDQMGNFKATLQEIRADVRALAIRKEESDAH